MASRLLRPVHLLGRPRELGRPVGDPLPSLTQGSRRVVLAISSLLKLKTDRSVAIPGGLRRLLDLASCLERAGPATGYPPSLWATDRCPDSPGDRPGATAAAPQSWTWSAL